MTSPTIWDLVLFATILIVALAVRHFVPAYFAEKGKNQATREDLEELTRKVEGIRIQYLGELERLRSDLARASLVHKSQYETEFRVRGDLAAYD